MPIYCSLRHLDVKGFLLSSFYMSTLTQPFPPIPKNGSPDRQSFNNFFEWWLGEQNQDLQKLTSASTNYNNEAASAHVSSSSGHDAVLRSLVDRVVKHYEQYYRTKSIWVNHDVLAMLTPTWRTSLEDAFLWIGGWRPSMAFHLLYSKLGLQLEAELQSLISGLSSGDLADLSTTQLNKIDDMQRQTIREEKEITEDMAKVQETVADKSMVELSHVVTEMMRAQEENDGGGGAGRGIEDGEVESTLASKAEKMKERLRRADNLRLKTLKGIVEILTPIQAAHFLIAAAELHLRVHDWGKKREHGGYDGHGDT